MHTLIRKYGAVAVLIGLFFVALALRTVSLETLPAEIHRDEAAIGYNAFSLLKTSRDEHGVGPWPLIFSSFGDFKLPGLVYLSMIPIHFFGLSVWSVRIGTAVLATLLIPITYLFLNTLFKNTKLALIGASLLAFSIWHTFLARTAYEPIAALTISTAAVTALLKGRTQWGWLFVSAGLFLISFAFYNLPLLLAPFVIMLFTSSYWSELRKSLLPSGIALAIISLTIAVTFLSLSSVTSAKSKTTFFNNPQLQAQLQQQKDTVFIAQAPELVRLLITNKYAYWSSLFARNYLQSFSFDYLFFSGGKNPWHNLNAIGLGDLNIACLPFLLYGFWILLQKTLKGSQAHAFLLSYLLLAPVPDALTIDAPVTNRLLDFHYALTLVAAVGVFQALQLNLSKKLMIAGVLSMGGLALFATSVFWFRYWYLHALTMPSAWNDGMRDVALATASHEAEFERIYINADELPGDFERIPVPYSYFLFFGAIDPTIVQKQGVWSERGGFSTLVSAGKYHFESLPRPGEIAREPILYISRSQLTELDPHFTVTPVFEVADQRGKTVWRGVKLVTHE